MVAYEGWKPDELNSSRKLKWSPASRAEHVRFAATVQLSYDTPSDEDILPLLQVLNLANHDEDVMKLINAKTKSALSYLMKHKLAGIVAIDKTSGTTEIHWPESTELWASDEWDGELDLDGVGLEVASSRASSRQPSGSPTPASYARPSIEFTANKSARIRRSRSSAERSNSSEAERASSHQERRHGMFVDDDDTPDSQHAGDDADATDETPLSRSQATSAAAIDPHEWVNAFMDALMRRSGQGGVQGDRASVEKSTSSTPSKSPLTTTPTPPADDNDDLMAKIESLMKKYMSRNNANGHIRETSQSLKTPERNSNRLTEIPKPRERSQIRTPASRGDSVFMDVDEPKMSGALNSYSSPGQTTPQRRDGEQPQRIIRSPKADTRHPQTGAVKATPPKMARFSPATQRKAEDIKKEINATSHHRTEAARRHHESKQDVTDEGKQHTGACLDDVKAFDERLDRLEKELADL